jgi:hypothetical protein
VDKRDWLTMLKAFQGKASDRMFRLFAVACCRQIYSLLTDDRSRTAVEVAENYADSQATADQLIAVRADSRRVAKAVEWNVAQEGAKSASRDSAFMAAVNAARDASWASAWNALGITSSAAAHRMCGDSAQTAVFNERLKTAEALQVHLLDDICGNPFRPVALDPAWLTWHGSLIRQLAQAAYDERQLPSGHLDPDRLAVLADALEEAGCTDPEILGHLRGQGPHTRGCHIVDTVLGRS